jgi:hypothetical protein
MYAQNSVVLGVFSGKQSSCIYLPFDIEATYDPRTRANERKKMQSTDHFLTDKYVGYVGILQANDEIVSNLDSLHLDDALLTLNPHWISTSAVELSKSR